MLARRSRRDVNPHGSADRITRQHADRKAPKNRRLRRIYEPEFAPGIGESLGLGDAVAQLNSGSLAQVSEHHADRFLPRRIAIASTIV
jgi:hypothetical protein